MRQRTMLHEDGAGTKLWLSRAAREARLVIQSADGTFKVIELDSDGAYEVPRALHAWASGKPMGIDRFERTPNGHINNCGMRSFVGEAGCQVCEGNCPDGEAIRKERGWRR